MFNYLEYLFNNKNSLLFIKFASTKIQSLNILNDIKNNKKLDHWTRDSIYNEYLLYLLNAENPNDALARALEYGIKWGEDKNANHGDVLRYGNVNEICYAITTGRISAWVVYNCNSGRKLLDTLSEEQKLIIWNYIDPDVWNKKFTDYKSDQLYVQQMLLEAGW